MLHDIKKTFWKLAQDTPTKRRNYILILIFFTLSKSGHITRKLLLFHNLSVRLIVVERPTSWYYILTINTPAILRLVFPRLEI